MVNSTSIPAWLVALSWIYTGLIWMSTRKHDIRMDSRIWGVTFVLTGILYLMVYIPHESIDKIIELEIRIFMSRMLMLLLSMSQWLPITISYLRQVNRGKY